MRNRRLQNKVTAGRFTLPAVILVCTLCWVLTYFLFPRLSTTFSPEGSPSLWQSFRENWISNGIQQFASYLIYGLIGYFLIELNNQFSIIRMRASMQTALFFLLVTVCPQMHLLHTGDLTAIPLLLSVYFLFKSYQQSQASGQLFHSFLFLGAGSILFPQLTFLSVLWLLEASQFRSLTPRSFCGALLGWLLPYWLLFGHAFFYEDMNLFYRPFTELTTWNPLFHWQILQPWEMATLGYLLLLFLISAVHCIAAGFEDKIRTRAYLQFLISLSAFLFLLIMLQPQYASNFLPTLTVSCSFLIGHYFVLTNSKGSNLLFIASLVGLTFLFVFNIWTLL